MYIDSHLHLTSSELVEEMDVVIQRAIHAKVNTMVNICVDLDSLEKGIALHKRYPHIYQAAAVTPHDAGKDQVPFLHAIEKAAQKRELIAIGETGLDYFYEHAPRESQATQLIKHCLLAKQYDLPLIFHCREAFSDLLRLTYEIDNVRPSLVHCFTGTLEEAKACLDRGWRLSFSGMVTFKKADALREVVQYTPIEHMLVETDSPYLAPHPYRGKRNEPALIVDIFALMAQLKGMTIPSFCEAVEKTFRDFFHLSKTS